MCNSSTHTVADSADHAKRMESQMREATVFKDWQADYAAHGIATFPVSISSDGGKKPLVQYAQPHGCVRDIVT